MFSLCVTSAFGNPMVCKRSWYSMEGSLVGLIGEVSVFRIGHLVPKARRGDVANRIRIAEQHAAPALGKHWVLKEVGERLG